MAKWALGLVLAVLLAGCGNASRPSLQNDANTGTVHVRQVHEGVSMYIEGSYSYVRVARGDTPVTEARLEGSGPIPETTIRLDPGTYRLDSFQRPCDGNCGTLDPPMDECTKTVQVESDSLVEATVHLSPGKGCTIETDA